MDYFNTIFDNDALFGDFVAQIEGLWLSFKKAVNLTESARDRTGSYKTILDLETQMLQNKPLVKKTVTPNFKPQMQSPNDLFQRYWVHP